MEHRQVEFPVSEWKKGGALNSVQKESDSQEQHKVRVTKYDFQDPYALLNVVFSKPVLSMLCKLNAPSIGDLLLTVYSYRERYMELVKRAIDIEIESQQDSSTLFRANSICCRILSSCCRKIGAPYLRTVLYNTVRTISEYKKDLEIEPNKKVSEDQKKSSRKFLKRKLIQLTNELQKSVEDCPREIRYMCFYLADASKKRFPSLSPHFGVCSIFFLRFLVPALVNPSTVGLSFESANLCLLARCTQQLVNNMQNKVDILTYLSSSFTIIHSNLLFFMSHLPKEANMGSWAKILISESTLKDALTSLAPHVQQCLSASNLSAAAESEVTSADASQ